MKKTFIITIVVVLLGIVGIKTTSVAAYDGKGTKGNPYVVKNEKDYRTVLTTKSKNGWTYVAIAGDITITRTVTVKTGKFKIYAKDQNRTIKRSAKENSPVNEKPGYCMIVDKDVQIDFGNSNLSGYVINLDGKRSDFESQGLQSSGWLYIKEDSTVSLFYNSCLKNVINNKIDADGAAIRCIGNLIVNGRISGCKGVNGGAIKVQGGNLTINSNTEIDNCQSSTEGGAIYGCLGCKVIMEGGTIRDCKAAEEGGGIFISGSSSCTIKGGIIRNNESGASAGGVFSGYGASLFVGEQAGGPEISYNNAKGSGGGVRCNGGDSDHAGGVTYFYGGIIKNNYAGKNGGGISCGPSNTKMDSRIYLKNVKLENNNSVNGGGGIRIAEKVQGTFGGAIIMERCTINGNKSQSSGGGIILYSEVEAVDSIFSNNTCRNNGGGINVNEGGKLHMKSSYSRGNSCEGNGKGVYVFGEFKISGNTYIDSGNEVYLTKGTYIDVIGKLNKESGLIANIKSEINDNGTKLVRANYSGTTPSKELYYNNVSNDEYSTTGVVIKKYKLISKDTGKVLRPSEKVNDITSDWIIISEKYEIKYDKNCDEQVDNFPNKRKKFWNEDVIISANYIARKGYEPNANKHWNTKRDGTGECIKPSTRYKTNANLMLYAIWQKEEVKIINIKTKNRYYVRGQKIILDKRELLRKVETEDNLNSGTIYDLRVTGITDKNTQIAKGNNINTEEYVTTNQCNRYILTIETQTKDGRVTAKAEMIVYILESPIGEAGIRFISYDYLNTLNSSSKWQRRLYNVISYSLKREPGEGLCRIDISNDRVNQIKKRIKINRYRIDNKVNRDTTNELHLQIK